MKLQFFNNAEGTLALVDGRAEYFIRFRDYIALETTEYYYELCRVKGHLEDEIIILLYGRQFFRTQEDAMNRVRDIAKLWEDSIPAT